MNEFEKLGAFYLGRSFDLKSQKMDEDVLYDSKDLTTHAVCIGMTGSGKTGLCVGLLEEAAIDGIPSLIIDPKGDMTNLLLTFPKLQAADFRPWIDPSAAKKKELSVDDFAKKQADMWKKGLKSWGQDGSRIRKLQDAAEYSIYTPGSNSGQPVSILKSFSAPNPDIVADRDTFTERISTTVTSLLGLIGITADPLKSREHILLSNLLKHHWQAGKDLTLSDLIQSVQAPPFTKIGVFNLDAFYPPKDRFELAMTLNNLLAQPTFQSWFEGEALDIDTLLYSSAGKPRVSVFYIAHLSDAERMFFVSLLLNQVIGWMRTQSGTSSLRAIVYFDELFGFMPPVGNPPSKKPLLTLLKQARAYGVGTVLATQNPVDLDYKGLSNTGTWFIGRLQTERDRDRVLDGLISAGSDEKFSRQSLIQTIGQLGKRVFLLHNVHEKKPVIFHTRWAMSYLAGPLTRNQIKDLVKGKKNAGKDQTSPAASGKSKRHNSVKPVLPPGIEQMFAPLSNTDDNAVAEYKPFLFGDADIHFLGKSSGVDLKKEICLLTPITDTAVAVDWEESEPTDLSPKQLLKKGGAKARFALLPRAAADPKNYKQWVKDLQSHLYRTEKIILFKSPTYKMVSKQGETERDFRIRLSQSAREQRDAWTESLRKKYEKKLNSIENKIRRAEERVEKERVQSKQVNLQTAISVGTTILGALFGSKRVTRTSVGKAGTAMRHAGRSVKEKGDVRRAEENLELLLEQKEELQQQFQMEVDSHEEKFNPLTEILTPVSVRPKKTDIRTSVSLVWMPRLEI